MNDLQKWLDGLEGIAGEYLCLSAAAKKLVQAKVTELLSVKSGLHALAERADAAAACTACGGQCCLCGRYHFSAIDYVAYLATEKELFKPNFAGTGCPFLNVDRCLAAPEYRPFNCITFACEQIERNLSVEEKVAFYAMERELRQVYLELQQIFLNPRMSRSVLSFMQDS